MARDKTILYLGLAGAAVAGAVLIAQGPKKKGKVIPAAPKPQGVQEKLGELKSMRAAIQANADKLSAADWLQLEDPFNAYMDEVLVYMLMVAHHVVWDSTDSARGPNGHVLSDEDAREKALASLPNFRPDDYIESVTPSLLGEIAGGAGMDVTTWMYYNLMIGYEYLRKQALRTELERLLKPLFQDYFETRRIVTQIFDGLKQLPLETVDPKVIIEVPGESVKIYKLPWGLKLPEHSEMVQVEVSPMSLIFARDERGRSFGYFWDFDIITGQLAEIDRASRREKGELAKIFLETAIEGLEFLVDRTHAVLKSVVTGKDIEAFDPNNPKGPSSQDLGTVLVIGGVVGLATLAMLSLGGRRQSSPGNTPSPIIIKT